MDKPIDIDELLGLLCCTRIFDRNETVVQRVCGILEDNAADCDGSVRKVRTGIRWYDCKRERSYERFGCPSLESFVAVLQKKMSGHKPLLAYGMVQMENYIRLRELPLDLLEGTDFPLELLTELGVRQRRGDDVAALIRYAILHHKLPAEPAHKPDRPEPPEPDPPSKIAARVVNAVRRGCTGVRALAGRTEGDSLDTGWSHKLDDSIRELITQWAAWRRIPPGELAALASYERKLDRDPPEADQRTAPQKGPADPPLSSSPPDSAPPAGPSEEPWYNVIGRAVLAHASPAESALLSEHLLNALAGLQPVEFNALCREVGLRFPDEEQREHLDAWLVLCGNWSYATRFIYLYNFMLIAQLPGWRLDLHSLRPLAEELPRSVLDYLEPAWRYYRLDGKPDGSPDQHDTLELGLWVLHGVQEQGYEVPVLVAAEAYEALADARERLERRLREAERQMAAAAAARPAEARQQAS